MASQTLAARCAIAGGGPAGIMLGYLLARAGIDTVVLEKWSDFFRDFRGDTIHPSTMNILGELGLLEKFLALPIQKTYQLGGRIGGEDIILADFSTTRMQTPFIAFIPQWDFLNFIANEARAFPHFRLMMQTEATGLIEENGRVTGLVARSGETDIEIRADLVVGADGRHSTVRQAAQLPVRDFGAPMDVLWFRIARNAHDPSHTLGTIDKGHMMIMIDRGDYWQCGYVISKGGFDALRSGGIDVLRNGICEVAPFLRDRVDALRSWDDVKCLSVTVDCLDKWSREGVMCIGDAAHAMSPIGGVGINLAIQDAVAAANILAPAFVRGAPSLADLRAVQKRRMFPVRVTQYFQRIIQHKVIEPVLGGTTRAHIPLMLRLFQRFALIRKIPAYLIGIGVRSEHIGPQLFAAHATQKFTRQ